MLLVWCAVWLDVMLLVVVVLVDALYAKSFPTHPSPDCLFLDGVMHDGRLRHAGPPSLGAAEGAGVVLRAALRQL
eukprot:2894680-Prorocentrum_lima.AAC.1